MSQPTADGHPVAPPADSHVPDGPAGSVPANYPAAPVAASASGLANAQSVGKIRGTGVAILLAFVTFGIYPLYWYYATHDEMKRHSGDGLGGGLALVLAIFIGVVSPFLNSSEVGKLYTRAGMRSPVSGATGLWYMPGIFILIGPLVWFIKTNGALNAYWRSQGAQG